MASGVVPIPREMSYPVDKHEDWHQKFDYVKFPMDGKKSCYRDVLPGRAQSPSRNDGGNALFFVLFALKNKSKSNFKFEIYANSFSYQNTS